MLEGKKRAPGRKGKEAGCCAPLRQEKEVAGRKIGTPWRRQDRRDGIQANEASAEAKAQFVNGPSEVERLVEKVVEIATGGGGISIPPPPSQAPIREGSRYG